MISAKSIWGNLVRLVCLLAVLRVVVSESSAAAGERTSQPAKILDRLWIWTHPAGVHDGIDLGEGRKGKSRMKPVEGAEYLG
jgi:hypothetical protein